MLYVVLTIHGTPPIRIVAHCWEPQLIVSKTLWQAGYTNSIEAQFIEPHRSPEEKVTAERIVNAVFRREHQS